MNNKILFYTDTEKYGEFSNFYPSKIKLNIGKEIIVCETVENSYQASKFLTNNKNNLVYAKLIATAPTPTQAFLYGRQKITKNGYPSKIALNPVIQASLDAGISPRKDWEEVKVEVMRGFLQQKFSDPDLRKLLLDTGDAELVEHTTRDKFWADAGDGSGQNWLGKLLMEVRSELQKENK
jgi:N-glycosidase YbiA